MTTNYFRKLRSRPWLGAAAPAPVPAPRPALAALAATRRPRRPWRPPRRAPPRHPRCPPRRVAAAAAKAGAARTRAELEIARAELGLAVARLEAEVAELEGEQQQREQQRRAADAAIAVANELRSRRRRSIGVAAAAEPGRDGVAHDVGRIGTFGRRTEPEVRHTPAAATEEALTHAAAAAVRGRRLSDGDLRRVYHVDRGGGCSSVALIYKPYVTTRTMVLYHPARRPSQRPTRSCHQGCRVQCVMPVRA